MTLQKRSIKWVNTALQLKAIACLFAVSVLVVASYVVFCMLGIWNMSMGAPPVESAVLQEVSELLARQCLTAVLLASCIATLIGMYTTFRLAGPLARITQYLKTMADRRWDEPCRLRSGDDLDELNSAVNGAVSTLATVIEDQQRALDLASRALESDDNASRREFEAEHARLRDLCEQRFGGVEDEAETERESAAESERESAAESVESVEPA